MGSVNYHKVRTSFFLPKCSTKLGELEPRTTYGKETSNDVASGSGECLLTITTLCYTQCTQAVAGPYAEFVCIWVTAKSERVRVLIHFRRSISSCVHDGLCTNTTQIAPC